LSPPPSSPQHAAATTATAAATLPPPPQEGMGGDAQFAALHQHWGAAPAATRALLLSTYAKLANLYPECRALVTPVFDKYACNGNLELQQRSCEYLALPRVGLEVRTKFFRLAVYL
jgi:hypothetical protein